MNIAIDTIQVEHRKRDANPERVRVLADSIRDLGLLHPVILRTDMRLAAGLHRLEACKLLGWLEIPATVLDLDDIQAEMAEIDENLIRADLTVLQESLQIARRKELYEALHPETRHGATGRGGKKEDTMSSFTEDTAAKTGVTDRTVSRRARIGEQLRDVADRLADSPIADNQKELLSLASLPENERDEVINKITSGDAETVSEARKQAGKERRLASPPLILSDACQVEHSSDTKHIRSNSVDAIITDPPYGISHYGGVTKVGNELVTADFDGESDWDSANPEEFLDRLYDWAEEWERLLKPGGSVVAFTDRVLISHLWDTLKRVTLRPKQVIVWAKTNPNPAGLARKNLISATEFMVWAVKPGAPYVFNEVDGWDRRNVIATSIIGGHEKVDHPTQKPLGVMSNLITLTTKPGDLILDPFAGSGSTGVAAIKLGRRAHLIDSDLNYVRMAEQRLAEISQEIAA